MRVGFAFGTRIKNATIDPFVAAMFNLKLVAPDHVQIRSPRLRKLAILDRQDFPLLAENRGWLPSEIDIEDTPSHDTNPANPKRGVAFFRLTSAGREEIIRTRREREEALAREIDEIAESVVFSPDGSVCRDGEWETAEAVAELLQTARPWTRAHYCLILRELLKRQPENEGLLLHANVVFSRIGLFGQGPVLDPIFRGNPTKEEREALVEALTPEYPPEAVDFVFESYNLHGDVES